MLLLLAVSLTLISILHFFFRRRKFFSAALRIPTPVSLPLIGELWLLARHNFNAVKALELTKKRHGDCFRLWGRGLLVFISKPEDMGTLCNHPANQDKGPMLDGLLEVLGTSLLTADGERAKADKKIFYRSFNNSSQEIIFDNFRTSKDKLLEMLKPEEGKWTKILHLLKYATSTAIFRSALSCNLEDYPHFKQSLLFDFQRLAFTALCRGMSPLHRINFLYDRFFGGNELKALMKRSYVDSFAYLASIRKEISELNAKGIQQPNQYIYNLLKEKPHATDEELMNDAYLVLFAGLDTTAVTTAFTLSILAMNPDAQELAYEEDQRVQRELGGEPLNEKSIAKYDYIARVVKESMRIYPPFPILPRKMSEDTKFGKYVAPKGTAVFGSILTLHRDPTIYENPSKFDPDRFLPENIAKRPKYSYMPFGAGLRNCPGCLNGIPSSCDAEYITYLHRTIDHRTMHPKLLQKTDYRTPARIRLCDLLQLGYEPFVWFMLRSEMPYNYMNTAGADVGVYHRLQQAVYSYKETGLRVVGNLSKSICDSNCNVPRLFHHSQLPNILQVWLYRRTRSESGLSN